MITFSIEWRLKKCFGIGVDEVIADSERLAIESFWKYRDKEDFEITNITKADSDSDIINYE